MKIGILVAGLPPDRLGGAETQAAQLAMLLARKHEVTVFTRSQIIAPTLKILQGYAICRRNRVSVPILRFPVDILSTLFCLSRRKGGIGVILAYQTVIDGFIGVLAKMLWNIPVVVSVQSEKEYQIRDHYKSQVFVPFIFANADRIFVQSQSIKNDLLNQFARSSGNGLQGIVENKLRIIPNGVFPVTEKAHGGESVLYVGRLIKAKGVDYLIAAMMNCPDQKLLIVGDGPEMGRLKQQARAMDNITFVGRVSPDQVSNYICKAKVLVLPSLRDEGLPNVILEAMAHGVPALATNVAGVPELVKDGETGFLIERGNATELAYYIRKLAYDEQLRTQLGRNCLRVVEQYTWDNVLPLYEDELRSLATGSHSYR
jgi:glycosyltransferase involved in cell wall biosynthesis